MSRISVSKGFLGHQRGPIIAEGRSSCGHYPRLNIRQLATSGSHKEGISSTGLTQSKEKVIILTGATAVGKTKASIELAQRIGGEIISADSVQVYKGLDVGSDKVKFLSSLSKALSKA